VTIATGKKAQNLKEMKEHLLNIHLGSIYHHFWGGLLRLRFDEPEYNNDFAEWVHHALQDNILAERLSVIDPDPFINLESLHQLEFSKELLLVHFYGNIRFDAVFLEEDTPQVNEAVLGATP
jgi:hypothetical protein